MTVASEGKRSCEEEREINKDIVIFISVENTLLDSNHPRLPVVEYFVSLDINKMVTMMTALNNILLYRTRTMHAYK